VDLSTTSSICVFGDSVVYAHTDPARGGWPGRLKQALTEVNDQGAVYALGIPGNTVRDVANRLDAEAAARHPDLIVIAVGTADSPNDFAPATPLATFRSTYRELIVRARAAATGVIVVTPPNIDETRASYGFTNRTVEPYVDAIRAITQEQGVPCVDVFGALSHHDFDRDGLHPTASGHDKLFTRIMATLQAPQRPAPT
jgi:lysophospholipase L1-like esterase